MIDDKYYVKGLKEEIEREMFGNKIINYREESWLDEEIKKHHKEYEEYISEDLQKKINERLQNLWNEVNSYVMAIEEEATKRFSKGIDETLLKGKINKGVKGYYSGIQRAYIDWLYDGVIESNYKEIKLVFERHLEDLWKYGKLSYLDLSKLTEEDEIKVIKIILKGLRDRGQLVKFLNLLEDLSTEKMVIYLPSVLKEEKALKILVNKRVIDEYQSVDKVQEGFTKEDREYYLREKFLPKVINEMYITKIMKEKGYEVDGSKIVMVEEKVLKKLRDPYYMGKSLRLSIIEKIDSILVKSKNLGDVEEIDLKLSILSLMKKGNNLYDTTEIIKFSRDTEYKIGEYIVNSDEYKSYAMGVLEKELRKLEEVKEENDGYI